MRCPPHPRRRRVWRGGTGSISTACVTHSLKLLRVIVDARIGHPPRSSSSVLRPVEADLCIGGGARLAAVRRNTSSSASASRSSPSLSSCRCTSTIGRKYSEKDDVRLGRVSTGRLIHAHSPHRSPPAPPQVRGAGDRLHHHAAAGSCSPAGAAATLAITTRTRSPQMGVGLGTWLYSTLGGDPGAQAGVRVVCADRAARPALAALWSVPFPQLSTGGCGIRGLAAR